MKELIIIIKYRMKILWNLIFKANTIYALILIILGIITFSDDILFKLPTMFDDQFLHKINRAPYNITIFLFLIFWIGLISDSLLITIFNYDTKYMRHLPIRVQTGYILLIIPVFFNVINYVSLYAYLKLIEKLEIINIHFILYLIILFIIFKFLPLMLICVAEKHRYNKLLNIIIGLLIFAGMPILAIISDIVIENPSSPLRYIFYFLPPYWLMKVLYGITLKDQFMIYFYSALILGFTFQSIRLLYSFKNYNYADHLYTEPELSQNKIKVSNWLSKLYPININFNKRTIYSALLINEIKSIQFNFLHAIMLIMFFIFSISSERYWISPTFLIFYFLPSAYTFSIEKSGLIYIKTLPISFKKYYWVKIILNTIYNILVAILILILSNLMGCIPDFSWNAINIIAGSLFIIWSNVIFADLYLCFADFRSGRIKNFTIVIFLILPLLLITVLYLSIIISLSTTYFKLLFYTFLIYLILHLFSHYFAFKNIDEFR